MLKAESAFGALLLDVVKSEGEGWKEWKRRLRKDPRWENCDLLDRANKERLFNDHLKVCPHSAPSQWHHVSFVEVASFCSDVQLMDTRNLQVFPFPFFAT